MTVNYFDELAIDPYDGNKSRKSSGFSETTTKSRQFSGYEQNKSRNCSGNSGSPGYLTNGKALSILTHRGIPDLCHKFFYPQLGPNIECFCSMDLDLERTSSLYWLSLNYW